MNFASHLLSPARWLGLLLAFILLGSSGLYSQTATVVVQPNALFFGTIDSGQTATRSFSVTNPNLDSVRITLTKPTGPFALTNRTTDSTFVLLTTGSRSVSVTYRPDSGGTPSRADTGSLEVISLNLRTNARDTQTVTLSGSSRSVSDTQEVTASVDRIDFDTVDVGDSATRTFQLRNNDDQDVTVRIDTLDSPFRITAGSGNGGGNATIRPGQSRNVTVRFRPDSAGFFRDTLVVVFTPSGSQPDTLRIPVTGIARDTTDGGSDTTIARLRANPQSLDFGTVDSTLTDTVRSFVLTNTDSINGGRRIAGVVRGADSPQFAITEGAGPFMLNPGETRRVSVRFMRSTTGNFVDSVIVDYASLDSITSLPSDTSRLIVPLTGRVLPGDDTTRGANVSFRDRVINFNDGDTVRTNSGGQLDTLRIRNDGDRPVVVQTAQNQPRAPFSIVSGGGTFTLQPQETRLVVFRFDPNRSGRFSDAVEFTYFPSGEPTSIDTARIILQGLAGDTVTTSVADETGSMQSQIGNVWPNPAVDAVAIPFTLDRAEHVSIDLYDSRGALVVGLVDAELEAGNQSILIATDRLANGTYFVRITLAGETVTRSLQIVR